MLSLAPLTLSFCISTSFLPSLLPQVAAVGPRRRLRPSRDWRPPSATLRPPPLPRSPTPSGERLARFVVVFFSPIFSIDLLAMAQRLRITTVISPAGCSEVAAAAAVTQHMTELSLSCDERGATASTAELTEPGRYQRWSAAFYPSPAGGAQLPAQGN